MLTQRKLVSYIEVVSLACLVLIIVVGINSCKLDYPAADNSRPVPPPSATPAKPDTAGKNCACPTPVSSTTISPVSSTTVSPVSSTTATPVQPVTPDTLSVQPPRFSPDGGTFYMSIPVKLTADSLPPQAVIEYSSNDGETWQTGTQFTLTVGGKILSRIRAGTKLSRIRSASFGLYFKRVLIIGNSIMYHPHSEPLGWFNDNGMAASAPEKDFVHVLTARLKTLYPALETSLQLFPGLNFEGKFGTPGYNLDEFNQPLTDFKPDLIIVRIGENIDDTQVASRNLENNFRQLLDRLANSTNPVRIICTTSVWYKPNTDNIFRKVTIEKGHTLVDLSGILGKSQCFASQYANPGVAAHPNDLGMQYIADMIWQKIQ